MTSSISMSGSQSLSCGPSGFLGQAPKRIGIPFMQYVLPFIFVALFHTLCVCVILKVLVESDGQNSWLLEVVLGRLSPF